MAINYLQFSHRQNMLMSSPNLPKSHPIWQQLSVQNFTIWIRCGCKWSGLGVAFFSLETCELKIQVICSLPAKPHTQWWDRDHINWHHSQRKEIEGTWQHRSLTIPKSSHIYVASSPDPGTVTWLGPASVPSYYSWLLALSSDIFFLFH